MKAVKVLGQTFKVTLSPTCQAGGRGGGPEGTREYEGRSLLKTIRPAKGLTRTPLKRGAGGRW